MNIKAAFFAVLLMALVTYVPRALPLAIFRRQIKSNYIKSFLQYVPFAVLGSLTFPDIFYSTGNFKTALCGVIVALFLAYRGKSLMTVAVCAIITVYATGFLF